MLEEYKNHDIAAYAGYLSNSEELLQCSSGGIATALAKKMIQNGGYVAGVAYSDDFYQAQYEIVHTENELHRFQGSKYVSVHKGTIYRDVKDLLDAGQSVLFFGLPCIVAALRSFLSQDYPNLLTVELICHGPTVAKVHSDYVKYLEQKFQGKVIEFSVKRKKEAWTPGYLYAKFDNGKEFQEEFYHTEYGYAFSVLSTPACYACPFRGNNRTGDLMIGDFWGATPEDEFWNPLGVSSILAHTQRGVSFLESVDGVRLFPTSFERIVEKNQNIIRPRARRAETAKFEALLQNHDLFYSVRHSRKLPTRIKAIIKKILGKH